MKNRNPNPYPPNLYPNAMVKFIATESDLYPNSTS